MLIPYLGDFDGLGSKRQVELMNSCVRLGIVEDNIYVLDNEHLQDGPGNMWDPDLVSSILSDFCLKHDIETVRFYIHPTLIEP